MPTDSGDVEFFGGPYTGLSYRETGKEFLRRHGMEMDVRHITTAEDRRLAEEFESYSTASWIARISKSSGRTIEIPISGGMSGVPSEYDVLCCCSADMFTEDSAPGIEKWQACLRSFFRGKNVRRDLMQVM